MIGFDWGSKRSEWEKIHSFGVWKAFCTDTLGDGCARIIGCFLFSLLYASSAIIGLIDHTSSRSSVLFRDFISQTQPAIKVS